MANRVFIKTLQDCVWPTVLRQQQRLQSGWRQLHADIQISAHMIRLRSGFIRLDFVCGCRHQRFNSVSTAIQQHTFAESTQYTKPCFLYVRDVINYVQMLMHTTASGLRSIRTLCAVAEAM